MLTRGQQGLGLLGSLSLSAEPGREGGSVPRGPGGRRGGRGVESRMNAARQERFDVENARTREERKKPGAQPFCLLERPTT